MNIQKIERRIIQIVFSCLSQNAPSQNFTADCTLTFNGLNILYTEDCLNGLYKDIRTRLNDLFEFSELKTDIDVFFGGGDEIIIEFEYADIYFQKSIDIEYFNK